MGREPTKRSPLKSKPFRSAGQSLEEQRHDLFEEYLLFPFVMLAGFVTVCIVQWISYFNNEPPRPFLWTGVAIVALLFVVYRFFKILPIIRRLKQGADGERAVGQYLEGLREQGYKVFHDVVAEGFNLDHVAIGPGGVFTIETKTWSKPARGEATVSFDGAEISAANGPGDRRPVIQAKAQAGWLKALLEESTGRKVSVRPVIVFPGWYVQASKQALSALWVLNPKGLPKFLEKSPVVLGTETVSLLSYHLSRHIRAQEIEIERERNSFWRSFRKRPLPE